MRISLTQILPPVMSLIFIGATVVVYPAPTFSSPHTAQVEQTTATELVNQGLQAIGSGEVKQALALFRQATYLDPSLAAGLITT